MAICELYTLKLFKLVIEQISKQNPKFIILDPIRYLSSLYQFKHIFFDFFEIVKTINKFQINLFPVVLISIYLLHMLTNSKIKAMLFKDIQKALFDQMFRNQEFIGHGMQGEVKKAITQDQMLVAIKLFKKNSISADIIKYVKSEIETLDEIRHEHILELIDSYKVITNSNFHRFCIVTEFCESNLSEYHLVQNLSPLKKLTMCYQIVSAIKAVHKHKIMHRDLKPENILIKYVSQMNIKVADFGCSRTDEGQDLTKSQYIGTPLYSDPNIQTGYYSVKCDVYSIGLVIIYIFCGEHIFSKCQTKRELIDSQEKLFTDIMGETRKFLQKYELPPSITNFLVEIAVFTLIQNEQNRLSSEDLLQFIKNEIQKLQNSANSEIQGSSISNTLTSVFQVEDESRSHIQVVDMTKKKKKSDYESQTLEYKPSSEKTIPKDLGLPKVSQFNQVSQIQSPLNQTTIKSQKSKNSLKSQNQQSTELSFERSFETEEIDCEKSKDEITSDFDDSPTDKSAQQKNSGISSSSLNRSQFVKPAKSFLQTPGNEQSTVLTPQKNKSHDDKEVQTKGQSQDSKFVKKSAATRTKDKIFGNLKTNSSILQEKLAVSAKNQESLLKNQKKSSIIRKNLIHQNQKKLSETEKLCSQLIKCEAEVSNANLELQIMRKILMNIRSNKIQFQNVKKIKQMSNSSLNFQQKQCLAFMIHYLYVNKVQDILRFSSGQNSHLSMNLKVEPNQISKQMKTKLAQLLSFEIQRVSPAIKQFAKDLGRKVNLMKPRLGDLTISMINDIQLSGEDFQIKYREETVKTQIHSFIQAKLKNFRNKEDEETIKAILKSVNRFC